MSVSDIVCTIDGPRMNMTWSNPVIGARALSVQISKSIEFIGIVRTFAIPPGNGISIDAGNGSWFFRVGTWTGTPQTGVITWSGVNGTAAKTDLCQSRGLFRPVGILNG